MSSQTDREDRVLAYVEQTFYSEGDFPTHEKICSDLGLTAGQLTAVLRNPKWKARMYRRGLVPPDDAKLLTYQQITAVNIILNTWDKKSLREKLKEINVTWAQYQGWMQQKAFQEYLKRRADYQFDHLEPVAKLKFAEAVEAGNMEAVMTVLDMKGIYSKNKTDGIDVHLLLTQVLEILTRHVTPDVLMLVAEELEMIAPAILNGRKQPMLSPPVAPEYIEVTEVEEEPTGDYVLSF